MTIIKKRQELPVFGDMMANLFDDRFFAPFQHTIQARIPAANVFEDEKDYTIQLAVPGMKKEDFSIDLNQNLLTISSEQKEEKSESTERFTLKEFSHTAFSRSFKIPKNGNSDEITASYTDGLLEIKITKKEPEQNAVKRIEIV